MGEGVKRLNVTIYCIYRIIYIFAENKSELWMQRLKLPEGK